LSWCGTAFSITNPAYRFGFDNTSNPGGGYGIPREHIGTNFIGRFTHAETSHLMFHYPGNCSDGFKNPLRQSTKLSYSNGVATDFANGPRAGEDLLVSNVHGFDIKVWDPAALAVRSGGLCTSLRAVALRESDNYDRLRLIPERFSCGDIC